MKRYQLFFVSLLFVATLFSSFHVHADGHVSEDCQICILQHNLASADVLDFSTLEEVVSFYEPLADANTFVSIQSVQNFHSRAPPLFS